MAELTSRMFIDDGAKLFGLRQGQERRVGFPAAHNASWFNGDREYLGWGDLSVHDLRVIASEIQDDEWFIVSTEETGPNWDPNKILYLVGHNELYRTDLGIGGGRSTVETDGTTFQVLSRQEVERLIHKEEPRRNILKRLLGIGT